MFKMWLAVIAVSIAVGLFLVFRVLDLEIEKPQSPKMFFITSDRKKIAYTLYPVEKPQGWLLLTHMMPETKESWSEFAKAMHGIGYESIAIDLRGHGESQGGPDSYKRFLDGEHQASIRDLEAAWVFLESRGAMPEKTTLIGASIGANLSLQFISINKDFKRAVLLSAGLDYRGIETKPLLNKLDIDQSLLFVTSRDDGDNEAQNQELYNRTPIANKKLIVYEAGGHGTQMFSVKETPNLTAAIKQFLGP